MDDRMVAGVRWAIKWLHSRAEEMNDGHAQLVLNSAATNLGWELQRVREQRQPIHVSERAAHNEGKGQ